MKSSFDLVSTRRFKSCKLVFKWQVQGGEERRVEGEHSSMMLPNKQVVFKNYVEGYPKESDFELRNSMISCQIPQGSKGLLVKNLYLGCDPYMRHRMSDHKSKDVSLLVSFKPGSVSGFPCHLLLTFLILFGFFPLILSPF